ncbi:MAG: GlxA family transcriptional regulator [Lacisediminihabitans sp.]
MIPAKVRWNEVNMPHRIAVVAVEGAVPLDLGIPVQIFGVVTGAHDEPLYTVELCTPTGGPIRTAGGFTLLPDHGLELLHRADTVIVAGPSCESEAAHGRIPPELADGLRAAASRGARMMSICTGAYVLAAAGLLDGRPATTHWRYAERFRTLFPAVRLDPDVLFVDDGDVLTSAGVAAGIDLCLHVVRSDHGAAAASASARRCVVAAARQGGQAQFVERPVLPAADGGIPAVLHWASGNLGADLGLETLAARATMSVRSFTRHFRQHTGQSPAAWVAAQRLALARELLETSPLSVDQIARHCGTGGPAQLRTAFRRSYGRSPSDYRRDFRAVRGG